MILIEEKNIIKQAQKKFRISSKKLYLIYPNCDLDLNDCLNQIKLKLDAFKAVKYLLIRKFIEIPEVINDSDDFQRENKLEPYIYVYLEAEKKINITNSSKLDLLKSDNTILKGIYQLSKAQKEIIKNLLLNSKSVNDPNVLYSVNLNNHSKTTSTVETNSINEEISKQIKLGNIKIALQMYEKAFPHSYLKQHMAIEKSFRSLYIKSLGITSKFQFSDFIIPKELEEALSVCFNQQKTLVLIGGPGTGKSKFIDSYLRDNLKLSPLLVNHLDALRYFAFGQNDSIFFDDCDFSKCSREELIKLFDSEDPTTFRVLHGSVRIPANTPRYVATNQDITQLLGKHFSDEAITRRFHLLTLESGTKLFQIK